MAAILEVWISKPGDPCYVDDHEWIVTVYDAGGKVFHWANRDYSNKVASNAHWADTIPPGCYVVQASGKDAVGKEIQTDHAIVEVGCEGVVCVRLYVSGPEKSRPDGCEITITDVTGVGSPNPTSIQVSGTAVNCNQVEVSVSCDDTATGKTVVSVSTNGQWTANVMARDLKCRCGGGIVVQAWCIADSKCINTFKGKLICKEESPK